MLGIKKNKNKKKQNNTLPVPGQSTAWVVQKNKQNTGWLSKHIIHLVHAYNCTLTYFLRFGWGARLPVDLTFGVSSDGTSTRSYTSMLETWDVSFRFPISWLREWQRRKIKEMRKGHQRVCFNPPASEDRVLLRNLGLHGKGGWMLSWNGTPLHSAQTQEE